MKISILLPYKENFSPEYPGAVSLFVYETSIISKFKKTIIELNIIVFYLKVQRVLQILTIDYLISSSASRNIKYSCCGEAIFFTC